MADIFANHGASLHSPAGNAAAITPSDGADLATAARSIYVGGAGTVAIIPVGGSTAVTFAGATAGSVLPIRAARVLATGTTATNLVALW